MMTRMSRRLADTYSHDARFRRAVWLVGSIVAVATGLLTIGGTAKAVADSRYVRQDTFALYRSGDLARHLRDSLISVSDQRELRAVLFGLDSSDRCHRGQKGYCR